MSRRNSAARMGTSHHCRADIVGCYNDAFRQLIDELPDAVLVHSDGKILFVNPACARLLAAASGEQLLGMHISEILHPDHLHAVEERMRIHREAGTRSAPLEHVVVALDGTHVDVEAVAIPCTWQGAPAFEVVIRDIRERKQAEQKDREWQKRLELAQRAGLRIGLWDWNLTTDSVVWSEESYRQFGLSRDTVPVPVAEAFNRIHPEDRAGVKEAIAKVLAGASNYAAQYRILRPDGSICWIDAHGVAIRNGSSHMLGVGIDITDLKNTEQSLKQSEEQYLMLLNSTAEGIYGLDLNGHCTFCNAAAARLLGYQDPQQLVGKNVHRAHHYRNPDGTPLHHEDCLIYQGFRDGVGTHAADELFFHVDGTPFPVEFWSYPIRRGTEIVGSVVTFWDITERIKAESQLRESESRYRSIVEEAPYGIYRTDREGQILQANPAMARMLGHSEAELLTLNVGRDIYVKANRREEIIVAALGSGRLRDVEVDWKRKDGSPIIVRMSGVPVANPEGEVKEFQVLVEDITERKVLERQFWQSQKLEAVGRLAGGVAHDFNNVLMIVSSYADLILQMEVDNPKLTEYARNIHAASMKAATVTQQLLAFSRKQMLEPEVLDPNQVVKDLNKILPKLLGEDIEFVARLDSSVYRVRVDRGQLEQIVMNLAVNARDAMPKGGRLLVETRNVTLDSKFASEHPPTSVGDYVMVAVTDNGTGMDAGTKARIFEPFFTTKERGRGTGLGLATVYGIVKQSGGFIWLNSEPGKGARFEIYLPQIKDMPSPQAKAYVSELNLRGSETILVVEDEAGLRMATCEFLSSRGYNVLPAANGVEAMLIGEHHEGNIDAVLTDLVMPGLDGVELGKAIQSSYPDVRLLYMSGYHDRAVEGLGPGSILLRKPCTLQLIAIKLREVIDSGPTTPQHDQTSLASD